MWELNHKEGWVLNNWYVQIVVLEKSLESPMYCKVIKPVNPKGNKFWIFIGSTDAEAEFTEIFTFQTDLLCNILATWLEELTL